MLATVADGLAGTAVLDSPRSEKTFRPTKDQPSYLTGGKLMDFQMEGVNFLRRYAAVLSHASFGLS